MRKIMSNRIKRALASMTAISMAVGMCVIPTALTAQAASVPITILVNGKKLAAKGKTAPKKVGKTYTTSAKSLAKSLGAKFKFVKKTKTFTIKKKKNTLSGVVNKKNAVFATSVGKKTKKSKVALRAKTKLVSGTPVVDVVSIAKKFGLKYSRYVTATKTLYIASKKIVVPATPTDGDGTAATPTTDASGNPIDASGNPIINPTGNANPTQTPGGTGADPANPSTSASVQVTEPPADLNIGEGEYGVAGLPVLYVNIDGNADVVDRNVDYGAQISIKDSGSDVLTTTPVTFGGRGSSSFADFPKKPFKFKFLNSTSVLGMPAAKKWALFADYDDKTIMRNALGFDFAAQLSNLPFTPSYKYVNLVMNGSYHGVYLVTERIEISSNRVNIAKNKTATQCGFIVQADKGASKPEKGLTAGYDYFNIENITTEPIACTYEDLDPEDLSSAQMQYIKETVQAASDALMNPADGNYKNLVDMNSLVDYYIACELTGHKDASKLSGVYMYKDSVAGAKLNFGPVWDFGEAFGVTDGSSDPEQLIMTKRDNWFKALVEKSPDFKAAVATRWEALSTQINSVVPNITTLTNLIQTSQALNFRRWPVLNTQLIENSFPQPMPGTFAGEVSYLSTWTTQKIAYLNTTFASWK